MSVPTIGLISGTGPQGRGLALRFALAGCLVRIGSRDNGRAKKIADDLNGRLAGIEKNEGLSNIIGTNNQEAVSSSEFVFLTVPFQHAGSVLKQHIMDFKSGSMLVDVTVPLIFGKGGVKTLELPEGSGSLHLRKILPPEIPFTGAFKTLPAHVLEDLNTPLNCDTFIFGDDKEAKERLNSIIQLIPELRPIDVGGLKSAAAIEGMTALLIGINRRLKIKGARFSIIGVN